MCPAANLARTTTRDDFSIAVSGKEGQMLELLGFHIRRAVLDYVCKVDHSCSRTETSLAIPEVRSCDDVVPGNLGGVPVETSSTINSIPSGGSSNSIYYATIYTHFSTFFSIAEVLASCCMLCFAAPFNRVLSVPKSTANILLHRDQDWWSAELHFINNFGQVINSTLNHAITPHW